MKDLTQFYSSLMKLVNDSGLPLRVEYDEEADIIKIMGEGATAKSKAEKGLEDIDEFTVTVAEHHPYWNIAYQCVYILRIVLEKWHDELDSRDLEEMNWSVKELENSMEKFTGKNK